MSDGARDLYFYFNGGNSSNKGGGIYKMNVLNGKPAGQW